MKTEAAEAMRRGIEGRHPATNHNPTLQRANRRSVRTIMTCTLSAHHRARDGATDAALLAALRAD